MSAAVAHIHARFVDLNRHSGKRGRSIYYQYGAMFVGDVCYGLDRLEHSGGCFGVDYGNDLCGTLREHLLYLIQFDDPPPLRLHNFEVSAASFDYVGHALTKEPVCADENPVAWLDEVHQRCFHACAACA